MYTINFDIQPLVGAGFTRSLPVTQLRIIRRTKRARYVFLDGANDSYWMGNVLVFELAWEWLDVATWSKLRDILGFVRNSNFGTVVSIASVTPSPLYMDDFFGNGGLAVDVDGDDVGELDIEWTERMPYEVVFITKQAQPL